MKVHSHSLSPSVARGLAAVCAAVFIIGAPSTARAAGVVGTGTAASCTDAALNTALADGGLVTFNCGGPATIDISAATGGTGGKFIFADTTIDGGGLVTIRGGDQDGIFTVGSPSDDTGRPSLTVNQLTIAESASGIRNGGGTVIVTNSTFTGIFRAPDTFSQGAILNGLPISSPNTSLTVTNSTFTDNPGGGIIISAGTVTVTNSTFTGNSFAGAILSQGGTLTVTNSTFTGNSVSDEFLRHAGGGGAINFTNSLSGPVLLRNTVLANNTSVEGGVSVDRNCSGAITDGGHNLDDGTSCGFSTANGSLSSTDPQLDPAGLRDNGGPTQTVALCTAAGVPAGCSAASPAIGAGDQAICAAAPVSNLDQRGFMRPGTGHTQCSIGAYEANGTAPAVCAGDCGGTDTVAINDLITLVNIALGNAQPSACAHGVPSGATVDITVILQAVNHALNGCGGEAFGYRFVSFENVQLPPGFTSFSPAAINDSGRVYGTVCNDPCSDPHIAFYKDGAVTVSQSVGSAAVVNAGGTVGGSVTIDPVNSVDQAALFHGDEVELIPRQPGEVFAFVTALNDSGTALVESDDDAFQPTYVLYSNGQTTPLNFGPSVTNPTFISAVTVGRFINNEGVIAGTTGDKFDGARGFRFDPRTGETLLLAPLPTETLAWGMGINTRGDVLGYSFRLTPHDYLERVGVWDSKGHFTAYITEGPDKIASNALLFNDNNLIVITLASGKRPDRNNSYLVPKPGVRLDLADLVENLPSGQNLSYIFAMNNNGDMIGSDDHNSRFLLERNGP